MSARVGVDPDSLHASGTRARGDWGPCDALAYLRDGSASATLNCGCGRGFSVLDVIDTVERVAGFKVEPAPRRAGDPAQIVAACDRIRSTLGWQPRFNDLQTIVAHALAWERKLSKRAG